MNPLLASSTLLALGALVCLLLWLKTGPLMTADVLLQRAENAVRVSPYPTEAKVISQKVRIRAASQSFERTIHRDAAGRRKPKHQPLDPQTSALQAKLAQAGVTWDEPLSPARYQDWREHSRVTRDTVRKTGDNLLTLTTTIADANVTEESLTVRASDFHPVTRTISFRDAGNVEIAELDYAVLPWADADSKWFEPLDASTFGMSGRGVHSQIMPHLGTLPLTEEEIDEAELGAMLALQLNADGDNRLQIVRRPNGVQVKGIVEDDSRKRDLEARLDTVPYVIPSIFTFQELERQSRSPSGGEAQSPKLGLESDEEKVSP